MDGATNPAAAAAAAAALAPALLTLDLDPPTPLVCDVEGAFSPLDVSDDVFISEESAGGGGGGGGGDKGGKGKTLSISKSGTIQIEGFEIRRSGLLATPLKNAPPRGGRASADGKATEAGPVGDGAVVGEGSGILSMQLADGGLWSLQDALAPLTVLGRGAGGTVWQAVHVPSLRVVAVKTIPVFEEGRRHQMVRELRALYANLAPLASPTTDDEAGDVVAATDGPQALERGLSQQSTASSTSGGGGSSGGCPQLVSFYDAYVNPTEGTVSIVQEYMDGGSLQDIVDGGGCPHEAILAHIAHQVLQGLAFLHERRQIHRDIKPANLLINHKGQVKISDFGLVRHLDSSVSRADTFVGTFTYMSPERICGEEYSYPADVWGLGLTLMACALGRCPYDHSNYWDLLQSLRESAPPELPSAQFSPAFRDFIRLCLAKSPAERPPARRLLTHPFVRPAAAAAPHIRRLRLEQQQQQRLPQGGSVRDGSESASGELADIVRAVQTHYRRRWARAAAAAAAAEGEPGGAGGALLLDELEEQEGPGAVPNTSAKALAGLARQLGLPLQSVRRAFQGMVKELVLELEAGAAAAGAGDA